MRQEIRVRDTSSDLSEIPDYKYFPSKFKDDLLQTATIQISAVRKSATVPKMCTLEK